MNTLTLLGDDEIRAMTTTAWCGRTGRAHVNPEHPFIRGTAHNPDTYFQAREAANPFYDDVPAVAEAVMEAFDRVTGRRYRLVEYEGAPHAERVVVLMGSGTETAREAANSLIRRGERVGVLQVRLFRPFPTRHLLAALPSTVRSIAVLDRTKEPGAVGEPLYLDLVGALHEAVAAGHRPAMPQIVGGRYGLSSKEFTPSMAAAVFTELASSHPRHGFTVGITDDVTHRSLAVPDEPAAVVPGMIQAVFFGLGSDGTVGANRNSARIIAEDAGLHVQAYFVLDSHKSGAQTVSHLRFGKEPIRRPYLIDRADFVACHRFAFLERVDVLGVAAPGATFLLNSAYGPAEVWDHLPRPVQEQILDKRLKLFVIDASAVAREAGLASRTNTVLQTCFFALAGVLPREEAIERIKAAIRATYVRQGEEVVRRNHHAVDQALDHLHQVTIPDRVTSRAGRRPPVPEGVPDFVRLVTGPLLAGRGDQLPVSLLPADGTFPSGTAAWEKRSLADHVPIWESDLCVQCGHCSFVCPHSVIRARYAGRAQLEGAPASFKSAPINGRGFPDVRFTLQSYVEDCTGCGLCVEVCPVQSPVEPGKKAINLGPKAEVLDAERANIAFFERLPVNDRARVDFATVRGVQFLEPLFEFSGACEGCGETPYLKVLSQLFGDRMLVANATGCSSIYGGNLPVTPWTVNREGRGPAWSNSLFEDGAEFGYGFRLAADLQLRLARSLLQQLAPRLGEDLVRQVLDAPQRQESEIRAQRLRVAGLKERLLSLTAEEPQANELLAVADQLVRRSVWIVGGDGWAYDIGFGGLDHVLATGRDVNVLVLDTEVYSNTGGQASKATPLGAVAKFAAAGKRVARKDLGLQAIAYGNVYVAQVAMGANPQQTLLALREAEAYPGPSLILAYSHCIAHGIDMRQGLRQQDLAAASGYWPLFRFDPAMREAERNPFRLDSPRPTIPFRDYAYNELRYRALAASHPQEAAELARMAQQVVDEKYRAYEELAGFGGERFHPPADRLG